MPWVRYVHFLTCGHLPELLNTDAPKLKFHKHTDFFTSDTVLPTFSSRPIEMNLANIPDLASRFVYFNDDMIVVAPIEPTRFFKDDLPIDYLMLDIPRGGWLYDHIRVKEPYVQTVRNSIDLLNTLFPLKKLFKERKDLVYDESYSRRDKFMSRNLARLGVFKWLKINHNPQPFLLEHLEKALSLFPERVHNTKQHRFRDYTDLNQYLYRYYSLMSGNFYPHRFYDDFCMVLASVERYQKERINYTQKAFICLNDSPFLKEEEYPVLRKMVVADLKALCPEKSSFEK